METYPLPQHLVDSLDEVLRNEARWLVKDMAKTLGVPAAPLLKKVLQKKRSVYLYESTETSYQCKALVPFKNVLKICRKPVLLHSPFCHDHQKWHPPAKLPKTKLVRFRIPYSDYSNLLIDKQTGRIYGPTMDCCGLYNFETKTAQIYKLAAPSEKDSS